MEDKWLPNQSRFQRILQNFQNFCEIHTLPGPCGIWARNPLTVPQGPGSRHPRHSVGEAPGPSAGPPRRGGEVSPASNVAARPSTGCREVDSGSCGGRRLCSGYQHDSLAGVRDRNLKSPSIAYRLSPTFKGDTDEAAQSVTFKGGGG